MAERPHGRVLVRVSGSGVAVRGDPQDLAGERTGDLRQAGVAGLPGGDIEEAVGSELQATAVVDDALGDAGQDRGRLAELIVLQGHREDTVVLGGRGVEEERPVHREVGGDRDAEQACLDLGDRFLDLADLDHVCLGVRAAVAVRYEAQHPARVALGDDRGAVREEGDAPGDGQSAGDGASDSGSSPGRVRRLVRGRLGGLVRGLGGRGVASVVVRLRGSAAGSKDPSEEHGCCQARPRTLHQPTRSRNSSRSRCTSSGFSICAK